MTEMQTIIDSFERDVTRSDLVKRLKAAEAEVAIKVAAVDEAKLERDSQAKKIETLVKQLNEAEGRHNAAAERDKVGCLVEIVLLWQFSQKVVLFSNHMHYN